MATMWLGSSIKHLEAALYQYCGLQ